MVSLRVPGSMSRSLFQESSPIWSMMRLMEVRRVRMTDPEGAQALEGWAVYERELYGDHPELHAVETAEFEPPDGAFFVVVENGSTVAGGGFRRHSRNTCEVKRMWTDPDHRRNGHASAILDAIENEARRLGYSSLCLETGPAQHESLAMYRRRYRELPAYHYEDAIAFGQPL
jgi:GNAT superfamily N-acetyltransferase